MKTKTLPNGNTKVWFDREEEFKIVNKTEPLIDTLIDATLLEKKYSRILVDEIKRDGLDDIHGVLLSLDEILQSKMDEIDVTRLDKIFQDFNTLFNTNYKYHKNSNGLISIIFGQYETYPEFQRNYLLSFLIKLFACKIDIIRCEEETPSLKGLTKFMERYAAQQMETYMDASRTLKYSYVIRLMQY
jgi:hypothetical protein